MNSQSYVSMEEFSKLDIRIGVVKDASTIPGSSKLIKLSVDLGDLGVRQIIAGVGLWYKPHELVGKQVAVVVNMQPRKMLGFISEGMILAADTANGPVLLTVEKSVEPGSKVR
ncbi:MAG: methionine--tRNA ligase subunit beta [Sulfolobales archaeon]|nr:methionine--tRNA ligase subunit beta [Sulfolobales archaeon]MCX8198880.1 methionine--tRNA ligase subunit beta [Sulfolobales archaeon]MDW8170799.1 methionine--tRNA ligase subunit beta [Desulfurococcaceae archaeon]